MLGKKKNKEVEEEVNPMDYIASDNGEQEEESPEEVIEQEEKAVEENQDVKMLMDRFQSMEAEIAELRAQKSEPKTQWHSQAPVYVQSKEESKFGSGTRHITDDDKIKDSNGRPIPISFFSIGQGRILSVYMKDGSEIIAPYNKPIIFKWETMDIGKSGHADDCIHFCKYDTWSQSEAEFIRNSPFFGRTIFDTITKTRGITPAIAAHIDKATSYVEGLDQGSLFSLAKQYGLEREKPSVMKSKLSQIKLQEILAGEADHTNKALQRIIGGNEAARAEQIQRESNS